MQMDVVSNMARDLLPLMLRVVPTDDRARHAVSLLATWDGTMDAARPEPLIFTAWLRALVRAIAADETGPLFERLWDLRPDFVRLVLTRKTTWCDDITTPKVETCADALATSLSAAMEEVAISEGDDIATWRWDHVHRARFPHIPFSFVPLLRDLVELSAPVGGGETTVARAAMPIVGPEPFAAVHGPGLRAIYDLSNLAASRFIVATGQSGNPLSPHYDDLLRLWQTGQSFALDGTREALHQSAEGDLTLTPATR
jgi:penicillin amidase